MTSPIGTSARRFTAAFTLVEITIVVFILATMLALAVPTFVRSYKTSQFNSASRSLVTLCQLARLKAAVHQQDAVLHIDLDQQAAWVTQTVALGADDDASSETEIIHRRIEISPAVRLVEAGLAEDAPHKQGEVVVKFYRNGTCDGAELKLQGQTAREVVSIRIDPVTARAKPVEVKKS